MQGDCPACRRSETDITSAPQLPAINTIITIIIKHVANVCAAGFFRLRQLRRIRRSLDSESAATLVHAFVSSWVDYCNTVFAGAPKFITDRLQRVLNAAVRVVSDTQKFDRGLSRLNAHQAALAGRSRKSPV